MPALITHHLFGEEAARRLPDTLLSSEEEKIAFLLGNQGPDPFLFRFRTLPEAATSCHRLGNRMHREKVHQAFYSLRGAVVQLRESDDTQAVSGLVQRILGQSRSLDPCLHSLTDPETARKISEQARQGISLPQGCRFSPRCERAQDLCRTTAPHLRELEPGHCVACHFPIHREVRS